MNPHSFANDHWHYFAGIAAESCPCSHVLDYLSIDAVEKSDVFHSGEHVFFLKPFHLVEEILALVANAAVHISVWTLMTMETPLDLMWPNFSADTARNVKSGPRSPKASGMVMHRVPTSSYSAQ